VAIARQKNPQVGLRLRIGRRRIANDFHVQGKRLGETSGASEGSSADGYRVPKRDLIMGASVA